MAPKTWTIKSLLTVSTDYLKQKGIENPRLDAEVLLAFQLDTDRVSLYLAFDKPLAEKEISGYRNLIKRRILHEPLQYITGVQEFWSLLFKVDQRVLIPRPESELLVSQAIAKATSNASYNGDLKILDLGTGSGVLAVSIAMELSSARVWATDISPEALELAFENAHRHGVSANIEFRRGDLWDPIKDEGLSFDIIMSNPPYVASDEFQDLSLEITNFEPKSALDGHEGGMYYIEKIISEGQRYLNKGGWLMIEMAPGQTKKALELIAQTNAYDRKGRIKDYADHYRVVEARRK
jgi:release factor glutamine methyltransferase